MKYIILRKLKKFTSFHLLKCEKRKKLSCGQDNAVLKIKKRKNKGIIRVRIL